MRRPREDESKWDWMEYADTLEAALRAERERAEKAEEALRAIRAVAVMSQSRHAKQEWKANFREIEHRALVRIEALRTNEHAAGFDEAREIADAALHPDKETP